MGDAPCAPLVSQVEIYLKSDSAAASGGVMVGQVKAWRKLKPAMPGDHTNFFLALQAGPGEWLVATFTTPPVTPVDAMLLIYAGGGVYRNGAIRQAAPSRWAACGAVGLP